MLEYTLEAEIAYRREQMPQRGRTSRQPASPSLLQRFREARRSRRNPVRGASRYWSDGPATRRLESGWISPAPHH